MVKVVLGFGSNIGNRKNNIKRAVKCLALNKDLDLLKISSLYLTEPWGYKEQKSFLNCAAVFLTRLRIHQLLKLIKSCEKMLGRVKRPKWQEREIDIDILFWGSRKIRDKSVKVPHPQLHNRNFVLKPLVEIIPGYMHPVFNKDIKYLCKNSCDKSKVIPVKHK